VWTHAKADIFFGFEPSPPWGLERDTEGNWGLSWRDTEGHWGFSWRDIGRVIQGEWG